MNLWLELLLFAVGLVLIIKGGDFFVDAASWLAEVSGIPKFIVGATIVSLATTLPELLVSLMAAVDGKVDMAVGNAVGSVTANTGLIMGLSLVFMAAAVRRKDYLVKSLLLIGSAAVVLGASLGGSLAMWGSFVLLAIFLVFIYENLRSAKAERDNAERLQPTKKEKIVNPIKFVLGAAGIVIGSRILVNSGSALAAMFGVPESIIAVTMVAIGTSLPELVTTITAIAKKQSSLSVGNIIGANIIDLTLILPLCAVVSGETLPISAQSLSLDMPACLIVIVFALLPMLVRQKFSRWQGFLLLGLYLVYMLVTVL